MITVYGGWPTRSQRVLWLLEEMEQPYAFHPVDLRKRRDDAEFMAVNPAGFLPAIRDGETRLVVSVAIMEYLIERYGPTELAPAAADPAFAPYKQFLQLGEAGFAAQLNVVVASRFFAAGGRAEKLGRGNGGRFFLQPPGHRQ